MHLCLFGAKPLMMCEWRHIGPHLWQFLVPSEFRNPTDKVPSEPGIKQFCHDSALRGSYFIKNLHGKIATVNTLLQYNSMNFLVFHGSNNNNIPL